MQHLAPEQEKKTHTHTQPKTSFGRILVLFLLQMMRHAPVAKPSAGRASTGTLRYNHVSFSMCYGVLYILAAEAVVFSCLFRKSQLHLKVDFMEGIRDEGMKKTNLSIGSYCLRIISVHFSFARKFTGYTSCAFSKVR